MAKTTSPGQGPDFLAGGGELGALMRATDWSATALGAPEHWPQSLKTCVRIILTSRQAMFVWWGDRLVNLYNDAYRAILGAKHPAALGQPAEQVWREIWDQISPRAESAMRRNEGTYDEKLLLVMERNGYPEETYYTFSYSPIPGEGGATGGIICANSDDTGEVVNERQLTLLREQASATVDARTVDQACLLSAASLATNPSDLPFALIYLADAERGSASLYARTGFDADHAGAPQTVPFDGSEPAAWSLDEVIRSQTARHLVALPDSRLPRGAWDRPPHHAAVLPIAPSGQGGRTGALVVGLNPYRLYDDGYRGFLTLVAAQLSSSIANARAYEEERLRAEALAEIDRAKTAFFSNVSHEFRTPLTLMLGPLEEAMTRLDGQVREREFELIETAHRNGLRLLKLVNTLLDFSRIEAGRMQAVFEPVDLTRLTVDLVSTFRSACERAGLALVVDCAALAEPVLVDRDMWEKIVLNLLSNAFKFTFEGSIAVALRPAGTAAELVVQDTGTGIPADQLPLLFERFHRVAGARGRSFEGSGIGLALVQELVRLHGGTVKVASEPDAGSTFTVTIPFGSAHLPAERVRAEPSGANTGTRSEAYVEEALRWLPDWPGEPETEIARADDETTVIPASVQRGGRILLVDDSADMRDYVRRLLASSGYVVETAVDGMAALEAVRRNPPDLVLSDVMMPRLDGFGLLRTLRADPGFADRPIILLSARAGEEARVEGMDAGADDYLTKPFSARELLARVGANLVTARTRRANTAALQALNDTLEARVAERTDELAAANRQLVGQIEEREQAESTLRQMQRLEAVGQLTSGIAHDFNNLLTVILGNADALSRAPAIAGDERSARRLANMRLAADRAATLTGQLLAFSRRQRLEPKPIDLNATVAAMSDLLRSSLGGSIRLDTALQPDPWLALVDATQIEFAILNLSINARDAMANGGSLRIETANVHIDGPRTRAGEPGPGDYVTVAVTDSGTGMSDEIRAKAFEPFFTTKDIGKGSGLGLAQVLGFAEQSGGGVSIATKVGEGTTVTVYLPRARVSTEAARRGLDGLTEPATSRRTRILIVDDDKEVREVTAAILEDEGFAVVDVGSGGAALEVLDDVNEFDLLLLDFAMPGMNGVELAREVRKRRAGLPILFVTGYAESGAIGEIREESVVKKPFRDGELITKIRATLAVA